MISAPHNPTDRAVPARQTRVRPQRGCHTLPVERAARLAAFGLGLFGSTLLAQSGERVDLGSLTTGSTVSFVRASEGEWGLAVEGAGNPGFRQAKPARIEVYRADDDIRPFAAGYATIEKSAAGADLLARAEIPCGDKVVFHVLDRWSLNGDVATVLRSIAVSGNAPGGFESSIVFAVDPSVGWADVNCLAPGALYGDPTYDGERSPGGTLNHAARRFLMREDILPAPLFALSFNGGASVSVLDPAPRGDSTVEETTLAQAVMIDAR